MDTGAGMFQQQVFILNIVLMVVDGLCVVFAGCSAAVIRSCQSSGLWSMCEYTLSASILLIVFLNNILMGKAGLYSDRRITSYWKLAVTLLTTVTVDFAALAAALFLFHQRFYSRAFLLYFASLTFLFLLAGRSLADICVKRVCRKGFNALRLFIVGDEARGKHVVDALRLQLSLGHQVVGHLAVYGNGRESARKLSELPGILKEKQVDEVVFAVPGDKTINLKACIDLCSRMGIPVRVLPALWTDGRSDIRVEQCQGLPFLTINSGSFSATGLVCKRMLDLVCSSMGLLVLALLYPFIAAAIKLDSPGPVLFKQDRVGKNGRIFKIYKFRSMHTDAEERLRELMAQNELSGPIFKLRNDPRITRVGRFLRTTSLDELPQLFNILTGKMSLVGTRPPIPAEVVRYEPGHYKRISAKPGLTGMWQVSGRNIITDFDQVVRLDCEYIENWRFSTDLKILAKTCWVVLGRKGAF
jgi:exopolysaccharide biosynthesis polyprenyl glycosylphosphotransferase